MESRTQRVSQNMGLTIVALGAFFTSLDQTVVVTALPDMMRDLKIPISEIDHSSWIITAYLLGYGVSMPIVGRLGDVFGYCRIYQIALAVFLLGSVMVAVSGSLSLVVGSRLFQSLGGSASIPIGMALAFTLLPVERRALALGIVGGAAEAGSMLGPAYGALVAEVLNWRWIFWLNIPQVLLMMVLLTRMRMDDRPHEASRVDFVGCGILIVGLSIVTVALYMEGFFSLTSFLPHVLILIGISLLILLFRHQSKISYPILPVHLFKSSAVISAMITQVLVGTALIIILVTVPLLANTVMGKNPSIGALWLLRLTIFIPVGAVIGGALFNLINTRVLTVIGLMLVGVGMLYAGTWSVNVRDPELTFTLSVTGLGFGLVIAPLMHVVLDNSPVGYRASSASWIVVLRVVGMTVGLAGLSSWGVGHYQDLTADLTNPVGLSSVSSEHTANLISAYADAGLKLFQHLLIIGGGIALIAIVPSFFIKTVNTDQES